MPFAKISPLRIVFIESSRELYQALALYDICYTDECPPHIVRSYLTQRLHIVEN